MKLLAVVASSALAMAPQQPTFKSAVDTVEIYVTVRHRDGRLVPNLPREEFRVRSDGRPVDLTVFSNDVRPITVVVLIDTSNSTARRMLWFREAASHFVDALKDDDRARIASFADEIAISPHLTADKSRLRQILRDEIWPGTGTLLWVAVDASMRSLQSETGRRVVLVLSDGIDSYSKMVDPTANAFDTPRRAIEGGFMIYALGADNRGLGSLKAVAEDTGGGYLEVRDGADLKRTMTEIAEELRHQYLLGFTPPNLDGKPHRLDVQLTTGTLRARAPRQYIARPKRP